ncbi:FMN-linked oxidoreductase [Rhodotorula sp. JG-1b]|nr:FMN-linked oxidoreductase [Rhodotorula sp. JG-1b]
MAAPEGEKPYWDTETGGIAPIKSSYVLWHKMGKNRKPLASSTIDDDAAEGRGHAQLDKPLLRTADVAPAADSPAPPAAAEPAAATSIPATEKQPSAAGETAVQGAVQEGQAEPEQKKVRLSGAQKKALAKQRQKEQWEAKIAAKREAKMLAKEEGSAADGGEGGRQRGKGQNKNRKFDNRAGEIRLCNQLAQGKPCERPNCKNDHDLAAFFASRPADIQRMTPATADDLTPVESPVTCPVFLSLGACPYGFKCRFGESHMRKVEDGQGFMQSGWELVVDEEKVAKRKAEIGEGKAKRSDRGEMNLMTMTDIKAVRGGGKSQEKFPLSVAYLNSIGEPLDSRERDDNNGRGGKGKKRGRNGDAKPEEAAESSAAAPTTTTPSAEAGSAEPVASTSAVAMDVETAAATETPRGDAAASAADDAHPSRTFVPDLAPIRASEKKRLDFAGKLWMAPLTTVGNLPFRRLAVEYGCDITTSEMGLAQEFLSGNANEWSLVRRHPSEKIFGVQICGSKPQVLVPAAEAIAKNCEIDFLDVNCGCPIDLVFNKGAGSALLAHATKLGKSLVGMSQVLGEVPLTAKIRTGVANNQPTAHKLMPRFQKEWGVSAVTMHGRSRQQRYKSFADYKYIGECVNVLRETVKDDDLAPIPIFGNGDAYDHRSYWDNVEQSGVDGIMIARGALIKPWIFTELKERRDWDISSRERLDMIGKLCNFGLEHWGSDQMGTNLTRRFVCEAMSFTHRYVPVGLLERLPTHMNERAFPYKGRDELETLLASDQAKDWVDITSMFLGPPPDDWTFTPKHKAASTETEAQG